VEVPVLDRRTFLKLTGTGVLVLVSGGAVAACDTPAPEVKVGSGFSARVIATSGALVAGTSYRWHANPDGGAVFPTSDGGWIYVSNSETLSGAGGASMVRFSASGAIVEARRILGGTSLNCAGGATPWGTWLSCEEHDNGQVYECDPAGVKAAVVRPAMGRFRHEAAAVDPVSRRIYLTEDHPQGALHRFLPTRWGDLSEGRLQVLTESAGLLAWKDVPRPSATAPATRDQVPNTKRFAGGEGTCWMGDSVFFTTKLDNKVWRYHPPTRALTVVYDLATTATPSLSGVDNLTTGPGGDLYVAEDGGNMEIVRLRPDGSVHPVAQVAVTGSELTGPAFSPDGTRLYFSSQRNPGTTYEVRGPF
jgi:hypothetical protein